LDMIHLLSKALSRQTFVMTVHLKLRKVHRTRLRRGKNIQKRHRRREARLQIRPRTLQRKRRRNQKQHRNCHGSRLSGKVQLARSLLQRTKRLEASVGMMMMRMEALPRRMQPLQLCHPRSRDTQLQHHRSQLQLPNLLLEFYQVARVTMTMTMIMTITPDINPTRPRIVKAKELKVGELHQARSHDLGRMQLLLEQVQLAEQRDMELMMSTSKAHRGMNRRPQVRLPGRMILAGRARQESRTMLDPQALQLSKISTTTLGARALQ